MTGRTRVNEQQAEFPEATVAQWRALVDADLKGAPFERKLVTHTYEGIYIRPLYHRGDWPGAATDSSGFSGFEPMTRGGMPLGTAVGGWDIRQERAEATAGELNRAVLDDLTHGVTSVVVRLDAAGREGLDADDSAAGSLVGTDGASLSAASDWVAAFEGVHLSMIGVGLEAGSAFVAAAAQLAALWEARGVTAGEARGAFNADPLAVLARDGQLACSLETGLSRAADLAAWTSARYPNVTAIRVGTAPYHHAGATATQDLAFSMATALEYLRAMERAGMSVDASAGQVQFSYAVGCSMFLAIAKLRAARRLWWRVLGACGAGVDARRMRMHVRTSKRVMTTRDPWVNLLRNTACVFAAGVGGADSIGSLAMDSALGSASDLTRRLARNTQLILQEESHLHRVNDPGGGSWYIEWLTEELARGAWVILQAIEARGGMAACLTSGWVRQQIDEAAQPRLKNVATRKDAITGVSEFAEVEEKPRARPTIDWATLRAGLRDASASEKRRGSAGAHAALAQLGAAAVGRARAGELSQTAFLAARAGATMGQIAAAVGGGGQTRLAEAIGPHPYAEPFEKLRDASDAHERTTGARPRVFLASMGPIAEHVARTTYSANFFQAGGFGVISGDGYERVEEAVKAFAESGASIAVICSSDARYAEIVPALARALHAAGARTVILAGNPGDKESEYVGAGVDRFIFVKCDVVGILSELLQEEGALA